MSSEVTAHGVLVGVDGSESSKNAVRWAASEAAMRHCRLTVINVARSFPVAASTFAWPAGRVPQEVLEIEENDGATVVAEAMSIAAGTGRNLPGEIGAQRLFGGPVNALVVSSRQAQLMVVGSRGRTGQHRRNLGPVASGLITHARCPVVVVHGDLAAGESETLPVLIGWDGYSTSDRALELAFAEASWRRTGLVVLHVVGTDDAYRDPRANWTALRRSAVESMNAALDRWRRRYPEVIVTSEVDCGRPARQLVVRSRSVQLVVVGSHGRGAVAGKLLGSVSAAVARDTSAPVLIVR